MEVPPPHEYSPNIYSSLWDTEYRVGNAYISSGVNELKNYCVEL